jgi:hypothetical protein
VASQEASGCQAVSATILPRAPALRKAFHAKASAHLTRKIYRLGERPLFELFRELDAGAPLIPCLEAYARLERFADFITANDGDRLPQPGLVPGQRT